MYSCWRDGRPAESARIYDERGRRSAGEPVTIRDQHSLAEPSVRITRTIVAPVRCSVWLVGSRAAGIVTAWTNWLPINFTPEDIDPIFASQSHALRWDVKPSGALGTDPRWPESLTSIVRADCKARLSDRSTCVHHHGEVRANRRTTASVLWAKYQRHENPLPTNLCLSVLRAE
jgi:hypothetical protein